jgi:uncharacterized membrane protein
MAHESSFRDVPIRSGDIAVRKIHLDDLWACLRAGYQDFNARPSFGVFLAVIYPLFAVLVTVLARGDGLLHLLFPVIAGLALVGPVVSVALFEMSRRRELGLDLGWRATFGFVHSASFAPILALSIVMVTLYVAWLFTAQSLYAGLFGADPPASLGDLWARLWSTRAGAAFVIYGCALGAMFAFATLAVSVIAFPLLLDRPTTAITAMGTSIRAVASNLAVMTAWGLIVASLLAAGTLLLLVGLAAVLPILGHATWHLYRRVVTA